MKYLKLFNEKVSCIGLIGKARSGKDTIADYLNSQYEIIKAPFADNLKRRAKNDFDLTYEQLWGNEKEIIDERYNKTPRQILQIMGTDWFRSIDSNFWIKENYRYINTIHSANINGISITDVRFQNEADFVQEIGGYLIKVERTDRDKISNEIHASETELESIKSDLVISNNGTLEELYAKVDIALIKLGIYLKVKEQ